MTHSSFNRISAAFAVCVALLLTSTTAYAQKSAPNLGTAATYGAFTGAGAIENTGLTVINGDIGTHVGSFTGFPPGIYTGEKHVADAASLAAKNDLILAYNSLNDATNGAIFDTAIGSTMGNGQVLTPRTYRRGDLTTLSGTLTFDAKGDPAAVFIIKIGAALNVAANTMLVLANGAQAANIYWAIDGAVSILDNTVFKGTILSNGAIHLYGGSSLEGRALAMVGAVTFASSVVTMPGSGTSGNNLVVITPAPGDTVRGGTQNYEIRYGGTGIAPTKTFEYSLDSGATWTLIGSVTSNDFTYRWDVPDTASRKAFVRITDANNMRGTSGMFLITSVSDSGAVDSGSIDRVMLTGLDAQNNIPNDRDLGISWTFTPDIGPAVTVEYTLDNGATWIHIATVSTSGPQSTTWRTPAVGSFSPVFVRVRSARGMEATSIPFSISSTASVSAETSTAGYSLSSYPNPASGETTVSIILPVAAEIRLSIVDNRGRAVGDIASQRVDAGTYTFEFNGAELAPGTYTYVLEANSVRLLERAIIVR